MDRAEATGFGVSVVGHCTLLAAAWLVVSRPTPPQVSQAFEVSYVDEVGLTAASPNPAPSAQASAAPEVAPPEEAAPAPAPAPVPEPTPAPPRASPRPAPSPERAAPPKPAPPQVARQQGSAATQRNTGSRLGAEILRGLGNDRNAQSNSPPAQMTGQAAANIGQAIRRQIQPCADRQINPGPGAERITTEISLSLNPDGSLAARPRAGQQTGIDDENRRYAARVADLAIASFVGCAPLRGLPAELYAVPRGWRNFTMRYRLPG
jgi:outer membrane biosynthesis protein TonB